MMYRIRVWERTTGEHQPVGELLCEIADNGRARSAFRYDAEFLGRPDRYALDPVSLPLKSDPFSTDHPGIFGVFEDSLPDDWGRRLLVRKHQIPRHEQNLPNLLLALGNSGLGALSFSDDSKPGPPSTDVSILHLSSLVAAAEKFERGDIHDPGLSLLLGAGSSPGGARPKVVVFDDEDGIHYLAKLPSVKDQVDVVKIEAATMNLAAKAGLTVPQTRLVDCAGKPVLLVRRFDVIPAGRRHMISFQTLLKAEGYYQLRYQELLAIVRKWSGDPLDDSQRFYRQMVFNAVVGNTDDHLKNFLMIHDSKQGWRLSPAFDLVPDVEQRGEHILFFDLGAYYPGRRQLENLGRQWGIGSAEVLVAQVCDAVAGWKEEFANRGVPEKDINRFKEIDVRLHD
jgi:serine/threonine-protein kinase HipA